MLHVAVCLIWQIGQPFLLVVLSLVREIHQARMVFPVAFWSCFMWDVRWCHTVCSPGILCMDISPPWSCSSFHNSSVRVSINQDRDVSCPIVCFISSSSSSRTVSDGSWIRCCICLPMSWEGVSLSPLPGQEFS